MPHSQRVRWARFSPDRSMLLTTGGQSGLVPLVVHDTSTWDVKYQLSGSNAYGCAEFSNDSKRIYARDNNNVIVINTSTWQIELTIPGTSAPGRFAVKQDDSRFAVSRASNPLAQEYNAQSGASLWARTTTGSASCILYSPGEDLILVKEGIWLRVFSASTYVQGDDIEVHTNYDVMPTADPSLILHVDNSSPYVAVMTDLYSREVVAVSDALPIDRSGFTVDVPSNTMWLYRTRSFGAIKEVLVYSLDGREFSLLSTLDISHMPGTYDHFAVLPPLAPPPPPGAFWGDFVFAREQ